MSKLIRGQNDYESWCKQNNREDLLAEWDSEKNGDLKPSDLTLQSKQKIWWQCIKGHEWTTPLYNRSGSNVSGCPYCSNQRILNGYNDLATTHPELIKEWNQTRNNGLNPSDFVSGSLTKVWWQCMKGHEWIATISSRAQNGRGCPYCSGRYAIKGVNDLATTNPELCAEWDAEKNGHLKPTDVKSGSAQKVWWKCAKGHEWEAAIHSRAGRNKSGCPYCGNKKVLAGYNDLATTHPELAIEWNYEKNDGLKPSDVVSGSSKKVWWIGPCGHEWDMPIWDRTGVKNAGCPFCSSKRLLKGFNDLATKCPELASQWDYEKNFPLLPSDVMRNSSKKCWWKCNKGHTWCAAPNSRKGETNGCPFCSHQKLLKGFNDLASSYPEVLSEWNYEKNSIAPDEIMAHTIKKVWWRCPSGHDYLMSTASKTRGRGCPICAMATHTSFPEQAIYFYTKKAFPDTINAYRKYIVELDVFVPSIKTAIEYDGYRAHKHKFKKDLEKNKLCKENGINLIRLREDLLPDLDDGLSTIIFLKQSNMKALEDAIKRLFDILHVSVDVDLLRDEVSIKELYDNFKKERSLADVAPELINEWHPTLNGDITPDKVYAKSSYKYWWRCSKGHEWQASTLKRVRDHRGCPYCTNQRVLKGYNDLASQFPDVAKQWSPKNALAPDEVIARSNKKYLWIGECGHEWEAAIPNLMKGCGCPYCANQRVLTGFNDIQTLKPELLKEWDYDKNAPVLPTEVMAGSTKKYWWKCSKCDYEWESTPGLRKGLGCKSCNQKEAGLKRRKRIMNVDTGEIYNSITDAEAKTGVSVQCIGLCCRGRLKTAGGYHWKYVD